jgi:hypothetical protein
VRKARPGNKGMTTMLEARYELEDGHYAAYIGEHRVFSTPEVALLVNKAGYTLVNHGAPEEVYRRHRQLLTAAARRPELSDAPETLVVVTGRFDLAELNSIIRRETTCRQLYSRLELEAARHTQDVLSQFALQPL